MAHVDQAVAEALLSYRKRLLADGDTFWPFIREGTKRGANKFFLGAIIDYQQTAKRAWEQSRIFAEETMGDPPDIWRAIVQRHPTEEDWMSKKAEYGLHRFSAAHKRVYRIGTDLINEYDGDTRRIWESGNRHEIENRLAELQVGPAITKMILVALRDIGLIANASDPKPDTHVCRVFGRIVRGTELLPHEVKTFARRLHPSAPWLLDVLGSGDESDDAAGACKATTPECRRCFDDIRAVCIYHKNIRSRL